MVIIESSVNPIKRKALQKNASEKRSEKTWKDIRTQTKRVEIPLLQHRWGPKIFEVQKKSNAANIIK